MQQNQQGKNIEQAYRAGIIVWLAMLFSQFMFVFLVYVTKPELFNVNALATAKFELNPVMIALGAVGLTTLAMSFVIKANLLKTAVEKQNIGMVQSATIVALALCEATSLFGLVSAFAFEFRFFFAFFAVGILGMLLHFPRREAFHAAAFKGLT